jgi:dolichol-phosphate mannosyltransferase
LERGDVNRPQIAITMPVFNEEKGICNFIAGIVEKLGDFDVTVIVIDDLSSDMTVESLKKLRESNSRLNLDIYCNNQNLGHGPSTIKGMFRALDYKPDLIVTIDGDGQFIEKEIFEAITEFIESRCDILEGNRIARQEPTFRKVSTLAVRVLVWLRCGVLPLDGNTPFRIYKAEKLQQVLKEMPVDFPIPNIYISVLSRHFKWDIRQKSMTSIPPRGVDPNGSTWKQRFKSLPSKRFLKFCINSLSRWAFFTKPKRIIK